MTKELNCEQRIQESQEYTELHIKAMFAVANNEIDDLDDENTDDVEVLRYINTNDVNDTDLFEHHLGVDVSKHYRIHLSTGGPASFIEVITNDENEILNVYYHFQDWFDGAKRKVDETSSIYRYAIYMLEYFTDMSNSK